jgi:Bifunctional DNA primase/polymerase, N-terminal
MSAARSAVLEAALDYAGRGWPCFPLVGKKPLKDSHGYKDATLEPDELRRMFVVRRVDGVGIAVGAAGLLVVDLDGPVAVEAWRELTDWLDPLAPTPVVRSPGGPDRWHLYFAGDDPRARSTSRGTVGPMIETKAAGHYVVAPPSTHPGGGRYAWARFAWPPSPAPEWLLELTKPKHVGPPPAGERRELEPGASATRYGAVALDGIVADMRAAVAGDKGGNGRNATLHRLARRCGRLVAAGQLAEDLAENELVAAAVAHGLDEREALATWRSGFDYGVQYPALVEDRR